MYRVAIALLALAVTGLAACKKPPSPELLAKLKGGTTTVVVYGFCVPMDYLIQTAITRYTLNYVVNGKTIGSMQSCSYKTFRVPSGYWESKFASASGMSFGHFVPASAFHPGKTQYLYMDPAGHGTFRGSWVSKAEADKGIAAIKKIGQFF